MEMRTDFLVIGTGIAGLTFAIKASRLGRVVLIAKKDRGESSTRYAQGGIASVMSRDDTFESHVQDTLTAGDGLCKEDVVRAVVRSGPDRIRELIDWGVQFSRRPEPGEAEYDLGREGGHSRRRILHAEDLTGREIQSALLDQVDADPNITLYEDHIAVDLLRPLDPRTGRRDSCWGAYVLDVKSGTVSTMLARITVLATGGGGKVYLYTSNPDTSTGDGIAMAYRARAKIANMEFIQFHPTCLYHPKAKSFLISEAVRGEGGRLRLLDGTPFMDKMHPLKELAPRDIVARAIDNELKRTGNEHIFLDITHKGSNFLKERFPNIYRTCLSFGIDMTTEPIPVVPAAHYTCGGVITDLQGRTNIGRLYAIGEVACTGLHGANRLASNSLLEAAVFADRAAADIAGDKEILSARFPDVPPWSPGHAVDSDESVVVSHNWDEIRRLMWHYVGIFRSNKRLERARRRIDGLIAEIHQYYWDFIITSDLIELRNIATVAGIIIASAISRKECRGLHYNIDYLERDDEEWCRDTLIWRGRP